MFGTSAPFPLSLARLRKFTGKGPRYDFLATMASKDLAFESYDFNVKAIDTTNIWTVAASSTSVTWAVLAEPGGWIRGGTGTSLATGAVHISAPQKYWNGTRGAGFASLIRLSSTVGVRLEQGFADVLPAVGTTAVNLASVAFNSVAAGAVYVYDNGSASAAVSGLYTIGVSIATAAVATTTNRYASGVTLFVAMEIDGTTVRLWLGDGDQPVATSTGGIEAANGLLPFVMCTNLAGASKNCDIDALWFWTKDRN